MEKRKLGKTNLEVSVLGFGGAEIGFQPIEFSAVENMLGQGIDGGLNIIDTAAAYMESEKLIGRALGNRRKEVHLVSKCGAIDGFTRSDWSKAGILRTVEQSLKNLNTDYLDVLLLHSCGALEFLWGEAGAGLQAAREKGYARFIGYSGDGASALEAIESGIFDVLETSINIADQEAIELLLPRALARNMGVIAKRPIANAAWAHATRPSSDYHVPYWQRFKLLAYPFLKSEMPAAVGTALRFTLSQPGVHTAIVGTTKPNRWRENSELIAAGPLAGAEVQKIRARWFEVSDCSWVGQI